ncbi:FAD:protein FMN transferase [Dictyobacter kobayashii]|uniref:FAD:protein FMN transferase n=1 Tax=Dictyobacter kobayashii TaxID=2014872 RepID=A0A402ACG5_9CHLR|nr:FAD:protein FMN transferase [Dictyobacter kobayashii]GCE16797.1 FAD:protein FMN transferase [Dictyobacter kobayashii]
MKNTRLLMGMPITVEVLDAAATEAILEQVFDYFIAVDERFSTYKTDSEISQINRGELPVERYSADMQTILKLSEQTREETQGYFDIHHNGSCDPSGIVKGWAIQNAAAILKAQGLQNFYIDAGGDVQVAGSKDGHPWRIGIRNPFNRNQNVKIVALTGQGIATSGTAIRGQHIYNPHDPQKQLQNIVSITVIGPNVYEADRFATAAFAMGEKGILFIEKLAGFEGYMIDAHARATYTSGFERYVLKS